MDSAATTATTPSNLVSSLFSQLPSSTGGSGSVGEYIAFAVLLLFGVLGWFAYQHQETVKQMFGSLLLQFHLGKNNEIHHTEIPPTSRVNKLIEGLGFTEEPRV